MLHVLLLFLLSIITKRLSLTGIFFPRALLIFFFLFKFLSSEATKKCYHPRKFLIPSTVSRPSTARSRVISGFQRCKQFPIIFIDFMKAYVFCSKSLVLFCSKSAQYMNWMIRGPQCPAPGAKLDSLFTIIQRAES